MRRLFAALIFVLITVLFLFNAPALADATPTSGAKIFGASCAGYHMKGGNVVVKTKTLKQDALKQYGMDSIAAITTQIKNGKGGMPGFSGRLNEQQIADVAAYVLAQAEKGWK